MNKLHGLDEFVACFEVELFKGLAENGREDGDELGC
jgi:hypothetical protein